MEPGSPLPCLDPATCFYPETYESSPSFPVLFYTDPFSYWSCLRLSLHSDLFPSGFPTKPRTHFSSPAHVILIELMTSRTLHLAKKIMKHLIISVYPPSFSSSLTQILPSANCSRIPSSCLLPMRDRTIFHARKKRGVILSYILTFLDRRQKNKRALTWSSVTYILRDRIRITDIIFFL
jgi:hypothetical protein